MSFLISQDGDVVHMYGDRVPPDEERFTQTVMVHKTCGGVVDVRQISESVQAIYCHQCGLRVTVPAGIKTFGDFREYLAAGAAPVDDALWRERERCMAAVCMLCSHGKPAERNGPHYSDAWYHRLPDGSRGAWCHASAIRSLGVPASREEGK